MPREGNKGKGTTRHSVLYDINHIHSAICGTSEVLSKREKRDGTEKRKIVKEGDK